MPKLLRDLQDEKYTLVQVDTDLEVLLDYLGLSQEIQDTITGAIVALGEGEYTEIWLTESARYYDLNAIYHPIEYYKEN